MNTLFEWATKKQGVLLRPTDDGFVTHSDAVFRFACEGRQARFVLPAGTPVVGDWKRSRARSAREIVRSKRCDYQAQEAYVGALRADGVKPSLADLTVLQIRRILA